MKLWYFGHPYSSRAENGKLANFNLCNERTVQLLDLGYKIFSPISHSHPLQKVKQNSSEFWIDLDSAFMDRCDGLILAPHWENSKGCEIEYDYFKKQNKPVLYFANIVASDNK